MFLDDKLTEILEEGVSNKTPMVDTCQALLDECLSRIPDPSTCSVQTWINSIKQAENGWKLFCKKHPGFNPDGFKNVLLNRTNRNPEYNPIYEKLGWL